MVREELVPSDPIGFIQDCVRRRRVLWTYHVNIRLAGRFIPREAYRPDSGEWQDAKCPEYLIEDGVLQRVDEILAGVEGGTELEIIRYAASSSGPVSPDKRIECLVPARRDSGANDQSDAASHP